MRQYYIHACLVVSLVVPLLAALPNPLQSTALKCFRVSGADEAATSISLGAAPSSVGETIYKRLPFEPARMHSMVTPTLFMYSDDDIYFIGFAAVFLTLMRAAVSRFVFSPIGRLMGVPRKHMPKFCESSWQFCCYLTSFTVGFTLYATSDFFLDNELLWAKYPTTHLSFEWKLYFMVSLAFWSHLLFVTLIEEWRKDFVMMVLHHVVTICLMSIAISMNYVPAGSLVVLTQDFADIFLPLAKLLKYAQFHNLCNVAFAMFAVAWIPTRHGVNFVLLYTLMYDGPRLVQTGWNPEIGSYYCWRRIMGPVCTMLWILQGLMLMWLVQLLKAVKRALFATGRIEDQRSESEVDDTTIERVKEE